MLQWILGKTIGTKNDREVQRLRKLVDQINDQEIQYHNLTDEALRNKTTEFRERLTQGETLDDLLIVAFAVVKNACRRLVGKTWNVVGHPMRWEMIPFDVQLIGGMVLHQGKIAEMATGEGKTLVATFPIYLNALAAPVHLVTVNDYLARRDCEWMGMIYQSLGLTVSCLQNDMDFAERKKVYACDIVYGTNSEFGFDYLRDNSMASRKEEQVQRGHFYAIVDEVDSILVDEARTPLIISGPASVSTHSYDEVKPLVQNLFQKQTLLCNRLLKEAREVIDKENATDEENDQCEIKLFQVLKGFPKNRQLLKMMEEPKVRKILDRIELQMMSDLRKEERFRVMEELYFTIDEKGNEIDLTDKGRQLISHGKDVDEFILPDLVGALQDVDVDAALTEDEKARKKEKIQAQYNDRSEKIHNLSQLLKAYSLFEKDVDYVVQDNKVLIVDEFTGRLMPGRRYSDGLHQALESKEGVKIERETQTFATITIQNYFRMYKKLSGMTGTAETEANEFFQIYKLPVVVIPTNDEIRRIDHHDVIYKTRREKFNAMIEEIAQLHQAYRPVLVGTISVETSEVLSRLLKRRGVPHSVLNARYHQQEAEIVSRAGQPGAVTIATNMAGRGTDIKLGGNVVKHENCALMMPRPNQDPCPYIEELGCRKKVPCGLHVIGSERHESRRIDRQLRGRSGRQGDPGSSRFYISLEDELMRLFGSDRIARVMDKMGLEEGQDLTHPLLTRSIETAQKRVEQRNFGIRKHTLEFDDVMNNQRKVIYEFRNHVLQSENLKEDVLEIIEEVVSGKAEEFLPVKNTQGDLTGLLKWVDSQFPLHVSQRGTQYEEKTPQEVREALLTEVKALYDFKEKIEEDRMRRLEQVVLLKVIDRLWKEHLYNMDALREGVYLRAYGQKDPLVEYRTEGFKMFSDMMDSMKEDIAKEIFTVSATPQYFETVFKRLPTQLIHRQADGFQSGVAPAASEGSAPRTALDSRPEMQVSPQAGGLKAPPIRRELPKVGRNDLCPCGSGKKYKKCCGM
ncbi:MAG: preprotein translocase subunit SecA [Chlamydiae bacterium]|nr:preprotein translocase subunit SecA [Chlamydiota bacterium]MBI3266838.1 preprotein translocase subunit SecA [Chlamydiota bacterium]